MGVHRLVLELYFEGQALTDYFPMILSFLVCFFTVGPLPLKNLHSTLKKDNLKLISLHLESVLMIEDRVQRVDNTDSRDIGGLDFVAECRGG
jgi:hypothetical protein